MRLVDADKARECFGGDGVTGAVMQRMFDSLPTIDAVPVVRCRDASTKMNVFAALNLLGEILCLSKTPTNIIH